MLRDFMSDAPSSPALIEGVQHQALAVVFGKIVRKRLVLIPLAIGLALLMAVFEPAHWRVLVLVLAMAPVGGYVVSEALRFRRTGTLRPGDIFWSLVVAVFGQTAVAVPTGAFGSPVLFAFVPMSFLAGLFTSLVQRRVLLVMQFAALTFLVGLQVGGFVPNPEFFGGALSVDSRAHLFAGAAVLSAVILVGSRAGNAARRVFDEMLAQGLRAQEVSLRVHGERTEELTLLAGEIAHELKNPLATVKGLAALLEEGVEPGKPAERLAVLRREVERMEGVLDEFLNYSRPLVPLALSGVPMKPFVEEVVQLHEGIALARGVRIDLHAEEAPSSIRCDPRKVRQIVINLLQNALEATPDGGVVEVSLASLAGAAAELRISDSGPGLDPAVATRVFEPGVTSKGTGHGLGLTIARALARQHGGDVVLSAREGGGCVARLRLPLAAQAPTAVSA
jgi:two-component system, NtrC family, sensor histidine kinase HydH